FAPALATGGLLLAGHPAAMTLRTHSKKKRLTMPRMGLAFRATVFMENAPFSRCRLFARLSSPRRQNSVLLWLPRQCGRNGLHDRKMLEKHQENGLFKADAQLYASSCKM